MGNTRPAHLQPQPVRPRQRPVVLANISRQASPQRSPKTTRPAPAALMGNTRPAHLQPQPVRPRQLPRRAPPMKRSGQAATTSRTETTPTAPPLRSLLLPHSRCPLRLAPPRLPPRHARRSSGCRCTTRGSSPPVPPELWYQATGKCPTSPALKVATAAELSTGLTGPRC